jgi:hypothetical protein
VIAGVKSAGVEVKSLLTTTAGLPPVQRLEAGVSSLISLGAGFGSLTLPASVKMILDDAVLVMPLIKTAVGLLVPAGGDPAAVSAAMLRLRAAGASARS